MFFLPSQPSKKSHKKIKDMLDLRYQHLDNQGFSSTMYDAHVCIILIVFAILTKNKLPVLGNYSK